jgi:Ca2+-binding RTX toxin-like protein
MEDVMALFSASELTIYEGPFRRTIYGTQFNDVPLYGTVFNDDIFALDGNDAVYAGDGNDSVFGGKGDDALWGEAGDDYLAGEAGSDYLVGDLMAGPEMTLSTAAVVPIGWLAVQATTSTLSTIRAIW